MEMDEGGVAYGISPSSPPRAVGAWRGRMVVGGLLVVLSLTLSFLFVCQLLPCYPLPSEFFDGLGCMSMLTCYPLPR